MFFGGLEIWWQGYETIFRDKGSKARSFTKNKSFLCVSVFSCFSGRSFTYFLGTKFHQIFMNAQNATSPQAAQ
jgi:hypothetical protein